MMVGMINRILAVKYIHITSFDINRRHALVTSRHLNYGINHYYYYYSLTLK